MKRIINRKFKMNVVSLFLIFMLFVTCLYVPANSVSYKEVISGKIDSALQQKLEQLKDDETVAVSVWFSDIDHTKVKDKVEKKFQNKINTGEISQDAVDMVFSNSLSKEKIEGLRDNLKTQTAQEIVTAEREISSQFYIENNAKCLNNLFTQSPLPKIIYSCKYAPNIDMYLTKSQILSISCSEMVDSINYINIFSENDQSSKDLEYEQLPQEDKTNLTEDLVDGYSVAWQENTGVSYVRDVLGKTGEGIKVGMYDQAFPKWNDPSLLHKEIDSTLFYLRDNKNQRRTSIHSTNVATIITGQKGTYKGVVPDATLYCVYPDGKYYDKKAIEKLISEGNVNIINISGDINIHGDEQKQDAVNTYGDTSRWVDHVAVQHRVSIVFSSGNDGSNGVTSGHMSHNAIVVGNLDDKNTIDMSDDILADSSSYNSIESTVYKPDLVAPGSSLKIPYKNKAVPTSGTSFSAPIVTGIVAQLMQTDSTLILNPALVKAVLMAGTSNYSSHSIIKDDMAALNRKYGAGEVNAYNSYKTLSTLSYPKYSYGTFISEFSKTLTVPNSGENVRIALTWNKNISFLSDLDHAQSDDINVSDDAFIKLEVTTPSGEIWTSYNKFGNVQLVSIPAEKCKAGNYQIKVVRTSEITGNPFIEYGLAASNGEVMY